MAQVVVKSAEFVRSPKAFLNPKTGKLYVREYGRERFFPVIIDEQGVVWCNDERPISRSQLEISLGFAPIYEGGKVEITF